MNHPKHKRYRPLSLRRLRRRQQQETNKPAAGGVIPEFGAVSSVQSINVAVIGAYVDYAADNSRRRLNIAAGGVIPEFGAVCSVQSINVAVIEPT